MKYNLIIKNLTLEDLNVLQKVFKDYDCIIKNIDTSDEDGCLINHVTDHYTFMCDLYCLNPFNQN